MTSCIAPFTIRAEPERGHGGSERVAPCVDDLLGLRANGIDEVL
jgi:hypothetical protein